MTTTTDDKQVVDDGPPWRDWKRLAFYLRNARRTRNMTQVHLAKAAGVSERTVWTLEKGLGAHRCPRVFPHIEIALTWPLGTIESILDHGAEPRELIARPVPREERDDDGRTKP